jgi:hypothetical protein
MRLIWSVLLVLWLVPGWSTLSPREGLGSAARFTVTPVAIRGGSADRKVGRLTFLRGYRLTSPDPAFGGFSSLLVEGDRFTLLSDGGDIVRFRLDSAGHVANPWFGALPGGPGTGWVKEDRDSESMTRDPASGRIWVGFENYNQIWRYASGLARAERWVAPAAMRDWPSNGGPEAIVRLHDGRFVVFSEQQPGAHGQGRAALLFAGDPTAGNRPPLRFTYLPPRHYEPSDVAELPDGRLIVVNRRFSIGAWFTVVLTMVDPAAIRAGAMLKGTEIARFSDGVLHDNYEGVAVVRDRGNVNLWIVSDDNQSVFQQSLLLEFRLDPVD